MKTACSEWISGDSDDDDDGDRAKDAVNTGNRWVDGCVACGEKG